MRLSIGTYKFFNCKCRIDSFDLILNTVINKIYSSLFGRIESFRNKKMGIVGVNDDGEMCRRGL
jgi:hypothetical protein